MTNSVDQDEVANDEPPHQDLSRLQIQLFSSLVREAKIELLELLPFYLKNSNITLT